MDEATTTAVPEKSISEMSRDELDSYAEQLGIADAKGLKNADLVKDAIKEVLEEPRYSREQLLTEARPIAGCSRHAMAGALHAADTEQDFFTKTEAVELAEEFAGRKVVV